MVSPIDPNSSARDSYKKYHNGISQKIKEMLSQDSNSLAFLSDIHGTDDEKAPNGHSIEVIIGTDQTRSRQALTDDYFWDSNGLIPQLDTKGIPHIQKICVKKESHSLDGGYTVKTYASSRLVAIQVEVIYRIRNNRHRRDQFAADLAECILNFVKPLGIFRRVYDIHHTRTKMWIYILSRNN